MTHGRGGKGLTESLRRVALLPARYGITEDKLRQRVRAMTQQLARWEVVPTIPATAIALERHPAILKEYRQADPAVHGYHHMAYRGLDMQEQARDLDAARETFVRLGIPVRGFRAPYLRADRTTSKLLVKRGFAYDSSSAWFGLPASHAATPAAMELVQTRYGQVSTEPGELWMEGGIPELPVALPDDEILIDGLGIRSPAVIGRVLDAMFKSGSQSGRLLVLQVHPERYHFYTEALDAFLQSAKDAGAWTASLSEIASWVVKTRGRGWPGGCQTACAISGDLDAVTVSDFGHRVLEG